jgi:hypothetical protein
LAAYRVHQRGVAWLISGIIIIGGGIGLGLINYVAGENAAAGVGLALQPCRAAASAALGGVGGPSAASSLGGIGSSAGRGGIGIEEREEGGAGETIRRASAQDAASAAAAGGLVSAGDIAGVKWRYRQRIMLSMVSGENDAWRKLEA